MPAKQNLIGQQFEYLTVIKEIDKKTNKQFSNKQGTIWECQCKCGNLVYTTTSALNSKHTRSCGCLKNQKSSERMKKDLTNQRFGKLIALESINKKGSNGSYYWKCKCDCGNIIEVRADSLTTNNTQSCGCLTISHGVFAIIKLLKDNNISFTTEKTFENCRFEDTNKKARFDFYIDNKYLIEYDGEQHFFEGDKNFFNDNLDKRLEHDRYKNQWCKENNISLIRIPYWHLKDLCIKDLLLETSNFIL